MRVTPRLCLCAFVCFMVVYTPFMIDSVLHLKGEKTQENAADLIRAAEVLKHSMEKSLRQVGGEPTAAAPWPEQRPAAVRDTIVIEVAEGRIRMAMLHEYAPKHCSILMQLVDRGLYDGAIFYRGEPNFGLQTGPVLADGTRRTSPLGNIPLEYKVLNKFGTVNMARWDDPNSASTDFFILLGDAPHLDRNAQSPGYTVFAVVVEGIAIAKELSERPAKQEPGMRMLADPPQILRIYVERAWPVPQDALPLLAVAIDEGVPTPRA